MSGTTVIAVVGGGPAGAMTALLLARGGEHVTLFERAVFPRPKACGECLSAAATRLLDRHGLLPAIERAGPARLAGWRILAPAGHGFAACFQDVDRDLDGALALPRARLDAALLDAARAAGVDVRTDTAVTDFRPGAGPKLTVRDRTGPTAFRPRLVIGADGLRSVIARRSHAIRRAPRVRKFSFSAHVTGVSIDDWGEMHVARGLCAGLAGLGGDVANLTVVADTDLYGRAAAADPLAFFRWSLARFPALPARLVEARLNGRPLCGSGAESPPGPDAGRASHRRRSARQAGLLASGPFDVPTRRIAGAGWVLVGDAAGYFDPFTGQGIHHAMQGAEQLARWILRAPQVGLDRALARYAREHRRRARSAHTVQRVIDLVLRRPALANFAIHRLAAAPRMAEAILAVTADVASPLRLLSPGPILSLALPPQRRSTP